MTIQEVAYNDIDTRILLTVQDPDDDSFTLTGATLALWLQRPSGSVIARSLTIVDAVARTVEYYTVNGDLTEVGDWLLQVRVLQGDGDWATVDVGEHILRVRRRLVIS